ncbi:hypothetical protein GCM10009682_43810 [Luedemannella flava]|uniref:Uncharacterized protein n=1 Tax=Luedemannella flava TaxID=349316 RepID=A0ABN2MBH5_9ACTN
MGVRAALSHFRVPARRGAVIRGVSGLAIVLTVLACRLDPPVAAPTPSVPGGSGAPWTVLTDSGARHRATDTLCAQLDLTPLTRIYPVATRRPEAPARHGDYVDQDCFVTVRAAQVSPDSVIVGISARIWDTADGAASEFARGQHERCTVVPDVGTAARACDDPISGTTVEAYDGDAIVSVHWDESSTYQGDLPDLTTEVAVIARGTLATITTG